MQRFEKIAGLEFRITPLKPFGERWTPRKGRFVVDDWVNRDPAEVVKRTREASVAVVEDTWIKRKLWEYVPADPDGAIAHTDSSGTVETVAVQLLHAEGPRGASGYAKPQDLATAAVKNLYFLQEAYEKASPEMRSAYGLDLLLEQYTRERVFYSYEAGFLGSHGRMRERLTSMPERIAGWTWSAGDGDPDELRAERAALWAVYQPLDSFYRAIARDTVRLVHPWTEEPRSTVLAYQDQERRFEDDDNEMMRHFAVGEEMDFSAKPIRRNMILNLNPFRGNKTHFALYTTLIERQRRRYGY